MSTLLSDHPLGAHPRPGRAETRERLSKAAYDLLVIGGGILGTSVDWHSAQSGLRVAMVDAGDFAGATSSASSKLGAGVFAYSMLSAFGDGVGRLISPARAAADNPGLHTDGLKAVAVYGDHQMNDARVAVMTVRAAVRSGAVVINHAEVTGLRFTHGRVTGVDVQDRLDSTEFGIDARLAINATGPVGGPPAPHGGQGCGPSIRLSKGTHVVLKRKAPWKAARATPTDKYRLTFALPWEDQLLLGTTDEAYEGDPAEVRATGADIQQILDEAALSVRDEHLSRDLITLAFAGLRALPGGPGGVESAKRETVVTEGRGGMLSVAGGKWTTYRHIGRTVLRKVAQLHHSLSGDMKPVSHPPRWVSLPGLADPNEVAHRLLVHREAGARRDPLTTRHLATHYGSLSFDIAHLVSEDPALGERIDPDGPEIWAQVVYARDHEWAETVDDVLPRRTTLTVRGLGTDEVRAGVQDLLVQKD